MRNKIIMAVLSIALVASLVIVGCVEPREEEYEVTFHAGSVGGSWFILAAMFSDTWTKDIDNLYITTVPGGGAGNPVEVGRDTTGTHIGISSAPLLKEAREGSPTFQEMGAGEGFENLRGFASLGEGQICNFVLAADVVPDGVDTLGEFLKTKPAVRISAGERGTAGELYNRRVLELYGLTYDDIDEWGGRIEFTSYDDGVASIIDGHVDGLWNNSPIGHAKLIELATSRDVVFLSVDEEIIVKMRELYGLMRGVIPAGTYPKVDYDVPGPMEIYVLFGNQDMEDELAYQLTKVLLENKETWVAGRPQMRVFDPATAMDVGIPLHAGAERAYKELGFMK